MQMFYEKPGVVRTYMDSSLPSTIVVEWDNLYDGDVIKESCQAQLDKVKSGAKYLIIETSKAKGVPKQDIQSWFGDTLFPAFDKAGLKAMITVVPESALSKMAAKNWIRNGSPFGFDSYDAASLDDAKNLIKKLNG